MATTFASIVMVSVRCMVFVPRDSSVVTVGGAGFGPLSDAHPDSASTTAPAITNRSLVMNHPPVMWLATSAGRALRLRYGGERLRTCLLYTSPSPRDS